MDEWEALAELAKAASQGKWSTDPDYNCWVFCDGRFIASASEDKTVRVWA